MEDLRIVAARVWSLLGRKPVTTQAMVEALYANLRWYPPSQAAHVAGMLQSARLFLPGPTEGTWVGALEIDHLEVPMTYRPPSSLGSASLSSPAPDLLTRVLTETSRRSHEEVEVLRAETERTSRELEVLPEAAALLVAWRRNVELPELQGELDRRLRGDVPGR